MLISRGRHQVERASCDDQLLGLPTRGQGDFRGKGQPYQRWMMVRLGLPATLILVANSGAAGRNIDSSRNLRPKY
jgi:hypothetical protein